MPKKVFLTIDDGPSENTKTLVNLLLRHNIPALFFFRGDSLEKFPGSARYALKHGFHIGNHSYSHTAFSQLPEKQFFDEILHTEKLIDTCYTQTQVLRPHKTIRLPFGDRGAGSNMAKARTDFQQEKVIQLQKFLHENHFVGLNFGDISETEIDCGWTLDTQDYRTSFKQHPENYLDNFQQIWQTSTRSTEIVLMHDFRNDLGTNIHLLEYGIEYLLKNGAEFQSFITKEIENQPGFIM